MAKRTYIGVSGKARKVKKGYIGVSGKARKIKKAYIGIGGKARPCWSGGELAYYGTITALSNARAQSAAATIGNYALFAGGSYTDSQSNVSRGYTTVDTYNKSLTKGTATALSRSGASAIATTVGNYAIIAIDSDSYDDDGRVNAYNTSLTRSVITTLDVPMHDVATSVGNYALFGGGGNNTLYYPLLDSVEVYDTSLTKGTTVTLSTARYRLAATKVGNYALFGGGATGGSRVATVDAYNTSLTRSTPTALSVARHYLSATTVGNYALFGGGDDTSGSYYEGYTGGNSAVVDAYNTSLTRSIPTKLSVAREFMTATSVGEYALFAGGQVTAGSVGSYTYTLSAVVDAYNTSLTRTLPTALNTARATLASTSIGDYALFGGGRNNTTDSYRRSVCAVVDAYVIA